MSYEIAEFWVFDIIKTEGEFEFALWLLLLLSTSGFYDYIGVR